MRIALDVIALRCRRHFARPTAAQVADAVKFMPMGQTEGQMVLAALGPDILLTAQVCASAPLSALGSNAFATDLAQMQHETMDVRIFRS